MEMMETSEEIQVPRKGSRDSVRKLSQVINDVTLEIIEEISLLREENTKRLHLRRAEAYAMMILQQNSLLRVEMRKRKRAPTKMGAPLAETAKAPAMINELKGIPPSNEEEFEGY